MASSPFSDSDPDDAFDADMEALRRACMRSGNDPANLAAAGSVHNSDSDIDSDSDTGSTESSGGEDLGLLRRLRERFTLPSPAMDSSPSIAPFCSNKAPGETDDDEDLETLRAIQQRFTKYQSDSLNRNTVDITADPAVFGNGDINGPKTPNRCAELSKDHGQKVLDHEANSSNIRDLITSKFPRSAQNFVVALKKNRSCQKFIRRKLLELEAKIEKNKELKERAKCLMDFQVACKRNATRTICQRNDPRVTLISAKKPMPGRSSKTTLRKSGALYLGPDENHHVSNYRMVLERFPISLSIQPWSNAENENLKKGIKQQYQEMLILDSMNMTSESEGIMNSNLNTLILGGDELKPESIRSFIPLVNWNRLASMYLKGRSGAECEARWLNCVDPMISHDPWTANEDKKLLFIVQERGICNWIDISIALGIHRTPFQCLARYQRSLNPHILNKEWTESEDAKLCTAVENYGDKNWQMVAAYVEGRTGAQCSNRWKKTLIPERQKVGRWSVDEDKRLKIAVMLFGARNWGKIAHFVPGRTEVQCRERWLNCLDPTLNLKPWTAEEEAKLLDAFAIHGTCWSKIAACIPGRTDNQCRRRWKILLPEEVLMHKAAALIKKTALIGNFVGRESERPALGPNDFTSLTLIENVAGAKVGKKKLSNNLPKESRSKPRRVTKNLKKVPVINSSTDLVSSDSTLPPNVECNSTRGSGVSRIRSNIPRKSRVKSQRFAKDHLTEDGMVNTSSDAVLVSMPPKTTVSLNAIESITQRIMDNHNRLSENQETSRISSVTTTAECSRKKRKASDNQAQMPETVAERSLDQCTTANGMVDASVEVPADVHVPLGSNASTAIDGITNPTKTTKRKRQSAKSRSQDTLTGGSGRDHLLSSEKDSSLGATPRENPQTNNMQSEETSRAMFGDGAVAIDAEDSSLCEPKRKRQRIVTEKNKQQVADPSRTKARKVVGGGAKRKKKCTATEENTEAAVGSSEHITMHGGNEVDDSTILSTFYKKVKRLRKCLATKEDRQAAKNLSDMKFCQL